MSSNSLIQKKCTPCKTGEGALNSDEIKRLEQDLSGWTIEDNHHLKKDYTFKNFKEALAFTVKLGCLSEEEAHHPNISLTWGHVSVCIYTHKVDGLTENDFILAAKCDIL